MIVITNKQNKHVVVNGNCQPDRDDDSRILVAMTST